MEAEMGPSPDTKPADLGLPRLQDHKKVTFVTYKLTSVRLSAIEAHCALRQHPLETPSPYKRGLRFLLPGSRGQACPARVPIARRMAQLQVLTAQGCPRPKFSRDRGCRTEATSRRQRRVVSAHPGFFLRAVGETERA